MTDDALDLCITRAQSATQLSIEHIQICVPFFKVNDKILHAFDVGKRSNNRIFPPGDNSSTQTVNKYDDSP